MKRRRKRVVPMSDKAIKQLLRQTCSADVAALAPLLRELLKARKRLRPIERDERARLRAARQPPLFPKLLDDQSFLDQDFHV